MRVASLVITGLLAFVPELFAATMFYVPLGSGNQVAGIDLSVNRVEVIIPAIPLTRGLAATQDGRYLVAGSMEACPGDGQSHFYLLDPTLGHMVGMITSPAPSANLVATPDGRYVLATHPESGGISIMDIQRFAVARQVKTGAQPVDIAVPSGATVAYVSNAGDQTISEIELQTGQVRRNFSVGEAIGPMVLSRDEQQLFAAVPTTGRVLTISTAEGEVVARNEVKMPVSSLGLSSDGKTLFLTATAENQLIALEVETGQARSVQLTPAPSQLSVLRETGAVYVASRERPLLWIVNELTLEVLDTIELPAGEGFRGVALTGAEAPEAER